MDQWDEPPYEPEEDEDWSWFDWLILPFALLWQYKYWALIAIGGIFAAFGVFDKAKVAESHSCSGYEFVRTLKTKGQINTFKAVQPKKGWECEYSLDNEDAEVRFREARGELKTEVDGYVSTPAYSASVRQMHAEGLHDVP